MAARAMTGDEFVECQLFMQQLRALNIDPDDPDHLKKFERKTKGLYHGDRCSEVGPRVSE